jgi:FkbM family methyltransferase
MHVLRRCIAWEMVRRRGAAISIPYDSGFRVTLKPGEGASRLAFYFGHSEPALFELYEQFVTPGHVVVDAGANIGLHALVFSRLVGPKGRVYAFEPDFLNFVRLEEHLLQNRIQNVTAADCALGESQTQAVLVRDPSDSSRSYLSSAASADGRSTAVSVISLDHFTARKGLERIDFLKVDVEGHEFPLLKGARDLMRRGVIKTMQIEFEPGNVRSSGATDSDILHLLSESGYQRCRWNEHLQSWQCAHNEQKLSTNDFFCHESLIA